jgi:hypothetical protein
MEKPGEKLLRSFFTFRYIGREPLSVPNFLDKRPDVADLHIYDIALTTGTLLYSCNGGIGVSKEKYIVDMHKFFGSSACVNALESQFVKTFGKEPSRRKYISLREAFNNNPFKTASLSDCANLYLLWSQSGFKLQYRGAGYDSIYAPTSIDYEGISQASMLSRRKNLLFRREDVFSLSESIINDNVVVYMHIPSEYGRYGPGFLWNESLLLKTVSILNEFDTLGYKVCISALHSKRGRVFRDYRQYFNKFNHLIVPVFKGPELTLRPESSEIYFLNF